MLPPALLWLALPAVAHPLGARFATQTSHLVVHPDRVEVTYVAEVPDTFVSSAAPRGGSDALDAMSNELAAGLVLLVDDQGVSMDRVDPWPEPHRSSDHTLAFTLRFEAALPVGGHTLQLQTANLQDASNFTAGLVDTTGGVRVVDTTLWAHDASGSLVRNDRARWRRDAREVTVTTLPPVAWWTIVHPPPAEAVSAWQARVRGPLDALPSGPPTPGGWLVALGASALAGLAASRSALRGPVALPWLGVLLALGPALAVDATLAGGLLVGSGALAWRARDPSVSRWQGVAWGAVGAGLAATVHAPRAAALVALAWTVGALLRSEPVGARLALVGLAALLALRALAAL